MLIRRALLRSKRGSSFPSDRANDLPERISTRSGRDVHLAEDPHDAKSAVRDPYVAFLDRQAEVFRDQRRSGFTRLGLKPVQAVLDAGCGPGTDTFDLEEFVMPGGRVVGVDSNEVMIAVARWRATVRGSQAQFMLNDVCALELPDETFDLARCVMLLLHVRDPATALGEMIRVLRPGGQLVCIDVDRQMIAVDATDVDLADRVLRGRFVELHPRMGTQLRGLFVSAGLDQVQVEAITEVSTSWSQFTALLGSSVFDSALSRGVATREELDELKSDLEARDAQGRFFSCATRMRCSGVKPK
jgi:SAM-dependent methyltransferase